MPFLIAITGGSGSGKSTLADALYKALGADRCVVLRDDCYYKPRNKHAVDVTHLSPADVARTINFDDTESKDIDMLLKDIRRLKAGETIRQPIYDFVNHDRLDETGPDIHPSDIVIAEGIHILSDPASAELFDLTVFVDTPADLRLSRRILRDKKERGRDTVDIIDQYMTFVRASHQRVTEPAKFTCDIVIADEGLPAYRHKHVTQTAINRMIAPVLSAIPK